MLLSGIYALLEPERVADPLGFTRALLAGGIRIVQIRAKRGIAREQLASLVAVAHECGGIVIVNDDVELAEIADGVHLGQEDAALHDLRAVRARLGARLIGLSCGTPAEARAVDPALIDYIGVGPIFATGTKADAGAPIGVNGVRAVAIAAPVPAAAIGGIDLAKVSRVRESGVAMAAVLSALTAGDDVAATARAFVRAWNA
ncbi:MAG: thiamine phosphate synthase [Candidatus Velthaea sp.]